MLNNPHDYDIALKSFLFNNRGLKEIDFVNHLVNEKKEQIEKMTNKTDNDFRLASEDFLKANKMEINPKSVEYYMQIERQKSNFRIRCLNDELRPLEIYRERLINSEIKEPELLDLSDSTAVEKIITLNELGIIDFLRGRAKAGISNGELASTISQFTGVNATTIKPSLNRLTNNDIMDNRHPYFTVTTVERVKKLLIKLGF